MLRNSPSSFEARVDAFVLADPQAIV